MGVVIMTMKDNLNESEMKRPIPCTRTEPIEAKYKKLRIAQYINSQQKLENE
jgi:hypothetical protein